MQTSSANSEHKHCEIERFSTLNERIIRHTIVQPQKTLSLLIVNALNSSAWADDVYLQMEHKQIETCNKQNVCVKTAINTKLKY